MTALTKNIIIPLIAFISGGGLTQVTNSCVKLSDEVQEWVAVISQPSSEDNISDAKFLDKSDYFSKQSGKK